MMGPELSINLTGMIVQYCITSLFFKPANDKYREITVYIMPHSDLQFLMNCLQSRIMNKIHNEID